MKPKTLDEANQMAGRSSRSMKSHNAHVICQDFFATSETIREKLIVDGIHKLKDGIDVAELMRGRRRLNINDDSRIEKQIKDGWKTKMQPIIKRLTLQEYKK